MQGSTADEEVERSLAAWQQKVAEAASAAADDRAAFAAYSQANRLVRLSRGKAEQGISGETKRDLIYEAKALMAEWQVKERKAVSAADAVVAARVAYYTLRNTWEETQRAEDAKTPNKIDKEAAREAFCVEQEQRERQEAAEEVSRQAAAAKAAEAARRAEEEHKKQEAAEQAHKAQDDAIAEAHRKAEAARAAVAVQQAEEDRLAAAAAEAAAAAQKAEEDYAEVAPTPKTAADERPRGAQNVKRKAVAISRPGDYLFVGVPRDEDMRHMQLHVDAHVTPRGGVCKQGLYITGLKLGGRWVRALGGDIELYTTGGKFKSPEAVGLKVGGSGNMSLQEFDARIPAAKLEVTHYSPERPTKKDAHVNTMKLQFSVGPSTVTVGWAHEKVQEGFFNSLWLSVTNLGTKDFGGILGNDDANTALLAHSSACTEHKIMDEVPALRSWDSAVV